MNVHSVISLPEAPPFVQTWFIEHSPSILKDRFVKGIWLLPIKMKQRTIPAGSIIILSGLFAAVLTAASASLAQEFDISSLFGFGAGKDSVDYRFHYAPPSGSGNSNGTPSVLDNVLRGNFTVVNNKSDSWSVNQKLGRTDLSASPVIERTGLAVPETLWDIEAGGIYRHRFGERREGGINFSIGSASDKPFDGMRETTLKLGGTYSVPSGQKNAWLFSLNYSNNRYFANNIPFPGVAYLFKSPAPGLNALVGFPFFAISYKPGEKWSGRLAMFGPSNVSAEVAYHLHGPSKIYSGFDWSQQSWLRAHREDLPKRLFYDEKKWSLGFQTPVLKQVLIDLSGGYEYSRRFFEAESALKEDLAKVRLAPVWSAQGRVIVTWGSK